MNKKLLSMLCMFAVLGATQTKAELQGRTPAENGVTLTLGIGMSTAQQSAIVNNTNNEEDIATFPQDDKKQNTFAKFSTNFKQAYEFSAVQGINPGAPVVFPAAGAAGTAIPGYFIYTPTDTNKLLPVPNSAPTNPSQLLNIATPTASDAQSYATTLDQVATWKNNTFVAPKLRYDLVDNLNAATGIDVALGFGYKMFINGGFYVHPSVHFAYYNAKSVNAVQTSFEQIQFYTKAVNANAQYVSAATPLAGTIPAMSTPIALYGIDPETNVTQGMSGTIANALTYENQWYWRFMTAFGYQLSEGLSVEALVGYQMTRAKLSLQEAQGDFENSASLFDQPSDQSPILNAILLNNEEAFYNFNDNVGDMEEAQAKMISGVVLGLGMNFTIAKNLTMGVQLVNVFNAKRTYSIEGVLIAPEANHTAPTNTTNNNSSTANNTNNNASDNEPEEATTDFTAEIAQNQTGVSVNFTYLLPVGGDCNPAA